MTYNSLYITARNEDKARELARRLVEARLVACANVIGGATSVYRWQGDVVEEREAVIIAKTRADLADEAIASVKAWHEYDCPCAVAWPITAGERGYLEWIGEETGRTALLASPHRFLGIRAEGG